MKMIWSEWKSSKNCHVLVKQFHENIHSKTPSCRKIKSVFRDVKWCFNASWGLKGLSGCLPQYFLMKWLENSACENFMRIGWEISENHLPRLMWIRLTVLASDPCTRFLDGYKVKMTGKNCPNYTKKEEMHVQLCKNWRKKTRSCLILAKTVIRLLCLIYSC